jgi:hypothetical protein
MKRLIPLLLVLAFPLFARAEWRVNPRNADQIDRYEGGRQVGAWFKGECEYYRWDGRAWIKAPAPAALPTICDPDINFGIDVQKLADCQMRILEGHYLTRGGKTREISVAEAKDLIENGLPDDRLKPWIVAPGFPADKEKQIRDDFNRSALAATHRLWTGPIDHFHMQDSATKAPLGYEAGRVHLVDHDGRLIAWAKDYQTGDFDKIEAIRRPRPIDPDKVPDLRKPKPDPVIDPLKPASWPAGAWVLAAMIGGGVLLALVRKKV